MTGPPLPSIDWLPAPSKPELPADEIHVWRASLELEAQVRDCLALTLTPDEKSRAARFVFPRDRERFIAARGILRELLGTYLDQPPSALEFEYSSSGKPAIRSAGRSVAIQFNLSHSQGFALYAFAQGRRVGIDLEWIQPEFGGEEVAERVFSAAELTQLRALAPGSRAEGFFVRWTRKEAYLKARGDGFQIPPDRVDLSSTVGRPDRLFDDGSGRWYLTSFRPASDMVAALVAEGTGRRAVYFECPPSYARRCRTTGLGKSTS